MALTTPQRDTTVRELVQFVTTTSPCSYSRADLQAAVAAVDAWADANAVSFNNALPQPFRGSATSAQKAVLLALVCLRRAGQ